MADSDSDDELMNRLASSVMAHALPAEDCVHCGQPHAATICTICRSAHYCNEVRFVHPSVRITATTANSDVVGRTVRTRLLVYVCG